jgi:regulatory protein
MEHKITALTAQKRNRQRVNVYLDGEFAFGLTRIVAAWLFVGQDISDEKIAELKAEDEREVAYQKALKLLEYRPRSEREIRQNLQTNRVPEAVQDAVLERLRRAALLDDSRFANAWVQNRSEMRPRSRRALSYELRQRGIADEFIQDATRDLNEEELAYQAAVQQARKLRALEWQEFRKKMYGFLARRGFNYEVSAPAAARVWAELHETDPDGEVSDDTA